LGDSSSKVRQSKGKVLLHSMKEYLVWVVWRREECRVSTGIRTADCPTRGLVTVLIALSRRVLVEGVLPNVAGIYSLVINYKLGLMRVTEEVVRVRGA